MPELPEVETIRRGLAPVIVQQNIISINLGPKKLRWPTPIDLTKKLVNSLILDITRRGKYLLIMTQKGTLIIHLGMSGRIQLFNLQLSPPGPHDHLDILFSNGFNLRYTDPRRFGSILWTEQAPEQHHLLARLGPEPLSPQFTGEYLFQKAKARKINIKSFLMNSQIVTGIGNIYANEALFVAKISPITAAGNISQKDYQTLVKACKKVLLKAIKAGGTTLKDYHNAHGEMGTFSQQLLAYGREGQPCPNCNSCLKKILISKRATVYCPTCQSDQNICGEHPTKDAWAAA